MPWCPGCSKELSQRKKKCPECGHPLTKGPGFNEAIDFMDREWLAIRALDDAAQVEMLRTFLEANGYDVAIRNGDGRTRKRMSTNGAPHSGMLVLVPVPSARKASKLIRADSNWTETEPPDYSDDYVESVEDDDEECDIGEDELYDSDLSTDGYDRYDDFA